MELSDKLIEAIIMSATVGQFGTQIVEETFSLSVKALSEAKRQLYMNLCSGVVAFLAYFFTEEQFILKAAGLAFLSGVFADAALKFLKRKNEVTQAKSEELARQVADLEKRDLEDKVRLLELELKAHAKHESKSEQV